MPLVDNAWYVNYGNGTSTGYYAVPQWTTGTKVAGTIIRQFTAPAVGSERCFVCVVAGAASGTEPASWGVTRGALTTDNAVTWQECTGIAALNGDATNTPTWTTVKNTAVVLGQVIQNIAGTNYQICTVAGTAGNGAEPSFSSTAGTITNDGATLRWTSLGVVGNFAAWGAPHARLANAVASTWGAAGNKFFVGDNHAETQSTAISITLPSSSTLPCFVYCVDHTVAPPTSSGLKTTGSISTTGNVAITFSSGAVLRGYVYGIIFTSGSGANAVALNINTSSSQVFEACQFILGGTASSNNINFSTSNGFITLNNCTVQVGNAADVIAVGGRLLWKNTASAITGGTLPTTLFSLGNTAANIICDGVDFSALGSGKTLASMGNGNGRVLFKNCTLGSGVTVGSAGTTPAAVIDVVSSDSSGTNYREERYLYQGTQTIDTSVTRVGGASNGTTSVAWKIVTTSTSIWVLPFDTHPIAIWNNTITGNTTITVCGTINSSSLPNNDDIWMEITYYNSTLTPIDTFVTTTKSNNLASATPVASDTSNWNGGGSGAGWSPFKLTTTITSPVQAGYIYVTVRAAKASTTYYIDPLITLT